VPSDLWSGARDCRMGDLTSDGVMEQIIVTQSKEDYKISEINKVKL